jgi:hypothetical protein
VTLRTSETTLVTTPEHPFAKLGAGWTSASALAVGDRIVTRGAHDATLVGVEQRQVPPTPVYNLSVEKTHAYFVSDRALLVHNAGCGRGRGGGGEPSLEQVRAIVLPNQPFNNLGGDNSNCTACTMASLAGFNHVSTFVFAHRDQPHIVDSLGGLDLPRLKEAMAQIGLRSSRTPDEGEFPPANEWSAARDRAAQPSPPPFSHWNESVEFMRSSTANTFAVLLMNYRRGEYGDHALVGVRQDDGRIVFLDFQRDPPQVLDLGPTGLGLYSMDVIPTDVDWRTNNPLSNLVNRGGGAGPSGPR